MKTYLPAALLWVLLATPAQAYIDPGAGSAVISAVVGASVAASLFVKTYWYKLRSFFSRKPRDKDRRNG